MRYEAFGRVKAGADLLHIGSVEAKSDALARTYAHATYDEEDWDRLVVVRADDLLEVTDEPMAGIR